MMRPALLPTFLALFGVFASGAEVSSPLDGVLKLAVSQSRDDRVRALRLLKAAARPGNTTGDVATYHHAELCLRFHREGERGALDKAKESLASLQKNAGSRWGLRGKIGLLRVAALEGRRDEAVRGLDRLISASTRDERSVEAAYYLGLIRAEKRTDAAELRKALESLEYALKLHASVRRYAAPLVGAAEIRRERDRVRKLLRELGLGELKALFERAEKLRRAGRHRQAVGLYRRIVRDFPGRDLAERSALRVCQCRVALGEYDGAIEESRLFIARDPLGPYRGNAHLLIGDVLLEHRFNVRDSEPEFRCVLDPLHSRPAWVAEKRRFLIGHKLIDLAATPPATAPGETWKDPLGAAHERVGILEYIRKRFAAAAGHFEESARLGPPKGMEGREGVGMAEVAELCRKRRMPLDEELLGQGDDRTRLVLFLGSVYIRGWKDDRSYRLFERAWRNEFAGATDDQRAYARARMGARHLYRGETEKAVKIYAEVVSTFPKSPYAADALLQRASALSREGKLEEALPHIEACYSRYPKTKWADWALYQRAFISFNHEPALVALQYYRSALATYPRSIYVESAKSMVKILEDRIRRGKLDPEGAPLKRK